MKYLPILDLARTEEEKDALISEVEILIASVYKVKKGGFEEVLKKGIRISTKKVLEDILKKEKIDISDKKKLHLFLSDIETHIEKLKPLAITIAFEPSLSSIEKVYSFIKKELSSEYVVEFSIDPAILGGAIFSINGRYKDYSLKKKLDTYFQNV